MSGDSAAILFFSDGIEFKISNEAKIRTWLLDILKSEQKELSYINYIFLSDEALLIKNKEYLNHDYYTDIISFQLETSPIEGDIFISIDRIQENADELKIPFESELLRVIAHGLLHFIGYGDKTKTEKEKMRAKEDHYLSLFSPT